MRLTEKDFWIALHGLVLGSAYLLAFGGGIAGLWSLRPQWITEDGVRERLRRLQIGTWAMLISCWSSVLTGTYVVYIWYRDKSPNSAKSQLMADPLKAVWHTFGMEWKEHISWVSPMLTTTVAFLIYWYGKDLLYRDEIRRAALLLFSLAFFAAAVAGLLGAFINKVSPMF